MTVKLLFVLSCAIVAVSSAGILETLLSNLHETLHETQGRSSAPQSKCLCQTSSCLCCVDLNLTSTIDLGGPACVNLKQKDNNVSLNLNYGENPVHNATIKIADAANKPTCMNLLSDLAQLCAKFTSIKRQEQGYDGCLVVEPALMRTPQATYNIGCFNFYQGVRQIQSVITTTEPTSTHDGQSEEEEEDEVGLNTEDLLAAVSSTAEQGIALFSQWLGLNLNPNLNFTSSKEETPDSTGARHDTSNASSTATRLGRNMADSELISPEERSDERFKQLLSAQDNIMKESAKIGHMDDGQTTFIYPLAFDNTQNHKIQSPVVPRESRRGGRAYNIHQHVNEI